MLEWRGAGSFLGEATLRAQIWQSIVLILWLVAPTSLAIPMLPQVQFTGERFDFSQNVTVMKSEIAIDDLPTRRTDIDHALSEAALIPEIDYNQPYYWFATVLENRSEVERIVLDVSGSIADKIKVRIYDHHGLIYEATGGYFYEREFLTNVIPLSLQPNHPYLMVTAIESRYFSGNLSFALDNIENIKKLNMHSQAIVYACLGAMGILGVYNLVLFLSIRHRSYLYYSLYLFSMVVAWMAVFTILTRHFGIYHLWFTLVTFPLGMIFSSLFVSSFLELSQKTHPYLNRMIQAIVLMNIVAIAIFPLLTQYYQYYKFIVVSTSIWLLFALFLGVVRWIEGYKSARYLVLGFSVLMVGGSFSLLPGLGIEPVIDNFFVVTLVAMTLDIAILAIALADRINTYRRERAEALEMAYTKDLKILEVEQSANRALIESNEKLKEALDVSERADRKKKQFLMVVSHELRTPLNAVVDVVSELSPKTITPQVVQFIQHGTEKLSLLVDELTVFSELSDSVVEPKPSAVSMPAIMKKMEEMAHRLTTNQAIKFQWKGESRCSVNIDGYLLEMALKPIIENALKFCHEGKVFVSYHYDHFHKEIRWCIEDEGPGFDDHLAEELLTAFNQQSQGFTRDKGGLGLGLYIANQATKSLGGNILIARSIELGGAKVELILPTQEVEEQPLNIGVINRVLVVEDNPVNAKVMTGILNSLHIECAVAENGKVALDVAKFSHFDLVLMDLQMPVMDGFAATHALKQSNYVAPVVAVTANSELDARDRCYEVGMIDVLLKPVRRSELEACFRRLGGILPT